MQSIKPTNAKTMVELLESRVQVQGDSLLYTYLKSGEEIGRTISFADLAFRAKAIARSIESLISEKDRVMLLFHPGLEVMEAFFGALYANTIPVPLPSPKTSDLQNYLIKMMKIVKAASPNIVLTTTNLYELSSQFFNNIPELSSLKWVCIDNVEISEASQWQMPSIQNKDVSFLQFTSGSTSLPKGVIITHESLIHNLMCFDKGCIHDKDSKIVSWLPPFHDLGLIYGLLLPLYKGIQCYYIPNAAFIQKPLRWLSAISNFKASHSMGPNFAYDHCIRRIKDDQLTGLDLSRWDMAMNAAEPVRMETMVAFYEKFKKVGFKWKTFNICYGLAESTCITSSGHAKSKKNDREEVQELLISKKAFSDNKVVQVDKNAEDAISIVGCGYPIDGEILIVNPQTEIPCQEDEIGEIWIRGQSVAQGYWNDKEKTETEFIGKINKKQYLRSGDLGFLYKGQVYITGRKKDVIIIRGQNHYPQDLEWTVINSHEHIRPAGCAAFQVDEFSSSVVIVVEISRRFNIENSEVIGELISTKINKEHALTVDAIAYIKEGSIPKTTSGKIQRRKCKTDYLDNTLNKIAEWRRIQKESKASDGSEKKITENALVDFLIQTVSGILGKQPSNINIEDTFSSLGIDSQMAVSISGEIQEYIGRNLEPTLLYNYPTIKRLVSHICIDHSKEKELTIINQEENPVCVIGYECVFPGCSDSKSFWQLLYGGKSGISAMDRSRSIWLSELTGISHELISNRFGSAGFISDWDTFDPQFFSISPREAELMDPQQRILLYTVWKALENAGLKASKLNNSETGVFIGMSGTDYSHFGFSSIPNPEGHLSTGTANSMAANRISYIFNLRGPSIVIDTACSSSLVALHLAVESLKRNECEYAIVAGVNLLLLPALTESLRNAGMLSPEFQCKTFDESADGYVRGEGCGVVILQRLASAQKDKRYIHGVIRGIAIRQDGKTNGLTAPNGVAQREVMALAIQRSGIPATDISYIEAHGTGTSLGDPIEFEALGHTYAQNRSENSKCFIGSVKTNIGHLEAAAGIAGLIKVLLSFHNQTIVPHCNLMKVNGKIDLTKYPFKISSSPVFWQCQSEQKRYAALSSMGFGGTNAHLILEDYSNKKLPCEFDSVPIIISAKTASAFSKQQEAFASAIRNQSSDWQTICLGSVLNRDRFEYRAGFVANSPNMLLEWLDSSIVPKKENSGNISKLVFEYSDLTVTDEEIRTLIENCAIFKRVHHDNIERITTLLPALKVGCPENDEEKFTNWFNSSLFKISLTETLTELGVMPNLLILKSQDAFLALYLACSINSNSLIDMTQLSEEANNAIFTVKQTFLFNGSLFLENEQVNIEKLFAPDNERKASAQVLTANNFKDGFILSVGSKIENPVSEERCSNITNYQTLLSALVVLSNNDIDVRWHELFKDVVIDPATLPSYPFEKKSYLFRPSTPKIPFTKTEISIPVDVSGNVNVILHSIKKITSDALKYPEGEIDISKPLIDLGADSLVFSEIAQKITSQYKVEVRVAQLFEELDTIEKLALLISKRVTQVPVNLTVGLQKQEDGSKNSLRYRISDIVGKLLKMPVDAVDPDKSFIEMGMDSLIISEFLRELQNQCAISLKIDDVFSKISSIKAICNNFGDSMNSLSPNYVDQPADPEKNEKSISEIFRLQLESFNKMVSEQNRILTSGKISEIQDTSNSVQILKTLPVPASVNQEMNISSLNTFTKKQQEFIFNLTAEYCILTKESKLYATKYRKMFADYRSSLGFKSILKEMQYPIVAKSAFGSRIKDLDDRDLIDLCMGFGSVLLGHNPEIVVKAIQEQLTNGIQVGPKCSLTGEVAELICSMTGAERVAFSNSGTEAVMTALRLARTATNKQKVLRFSGSYHGHSDATLARMGINYEQSVPQAAGVPENTVKDIWVLPYDSNEAIDFIECHRDELAAILIEPTQSRRPGLQPKDFIQKVREITARNNIALIFDEIITGFRIAPNGAQEVYECQADLITYGKVVGGGMPIGVIAGKERFMNGIDGGCWSYGDESSPGSKATFFAGTFSGHPLTMAVSKSVLSYLKGQGSGIIKELGDRTTKFALDLNRRFADEQFPIHVDSCGSLFRFVFKKNYSVEFQPIEANLFFFNMIKNGVFVWEGHTCFLSSAHSDADLSKISEAAMLSAHAMRDGGFFGVQTNSVQVTTEQPASIVSAIVFDEPIDIGQYQTAIEKLNRVCPDLLITSLRQSGLALLNGDYMSNDVIQKHFKSDPTYSFLVDRMVEILAEGGYLKPTEGGWIVTNVPNELPVKTTLNELRIENEFLSNEIMALDRCVKSIPAVLSKQFHPLEVLLPSNGTNDIENIYKDSIVSVHANKRVAEEIQKFVSLRKYSGKIRVLEIGAGTGGTTGEVLQSLEGNAFEYHCTDISQGFFAKLHSRFGNKIVTSVLDIEKPDFTRFSDFDIVIAANVIHATKKIENTLQNIRRLLKDDGKLILIEGVTKQAWVDLIWGLTPQWWAFTDCNYRTNHAYLDQDGWLAVLSKNGFVGCEYASLGSWLDVICAERKPNDPDIMLTKGQKEILVHASISDDANWAYNESAAFLVHGRIDHSVFLKSVRDLVDSHDSLRTVINKKGSTGKLVGTWYPQPVIHDLTTVVHAKQETEVESCISEVLSSRANVYQTPPFQVHLIILSLEKSIIMFLAHHVFVDGWSYGVLIDDFLKFYQANVAGRPLPIVNLHRWEGYEKRCQIEETSPEYEKSLLYWKELIGNNPTVLNLPLLESAPKVQSYNGRRIKRVLDKKILNDVEQFANQRKCTLFHVLNGAFNLLLHKVCQQDQIITGVPTTNRANDDKFLVGYCVSMLPVCSNVKPKDTFDSYLKRLREQHVKSSQNKKSSIGDIIRIVNPSREPSMPVLISAIFNYEKEEIAETNSLKVSAYTHGIVTTKYFLTMNVVSGGADGLIAIDYNCDVLSEQFAADFLERYLLCIDSMLQDPLHYVNDFSILTKKERQDIASWRSYLPVTSTYPSIDDLFVKQSRLTPKEIAIVCKNESLTYEQVDKASSNIAGWLVQNKITQNCRVGVLMNRTPALVITLLGILKSGATYVPIDKTYPFERIKFIINDSELSLIISDVADISFAADCPIVRYATIEETQNPFCASPETRAPGNIAYLIYTSGSTGVPKGVAITRLNAGVFLRWALDVFSVEDLKYVLFSTSICFDLSIFEVFAPLSCGGKIRIVDNIINYVEDFALEPLSLINTVPSAIDEVVKRVKIPRSVRVVNLAGEALQNSLVERVYANAAADVYNLYGPSEDTTYSTCKKVNRALDKPMTIGWPVSETDVYILDKNLNQVPLGIAGEIFIYSAKLSVGYWKRPSLTADRYIPNPFGIPGSRMYATGDIGRFLDQGEIEYLGRKDQQVKIRGYRIEIGEIESVLNSLDNISLCAIIPHGEFGKQNLLGFVTLKDKTLPIDSVQEILKVKLPAYMIPASITVLDEMPLNANGKIDRRALVAFVGQNKRSAFKEPENEIELQMVGLWKDVLNTEKISTTDNFFLIGGNSLMALDLVQRIVEEFSIEIKIIDLMKHPTVVLLSNAVMQKLLENLNDDELAQITTSEQVPN